MSLHTLADRIAARHRADPRTGRHTCSNCSGDCRASQCPSVVAAEARTEVGINPDDLSAARGIALSVGMSGAIVFSGVLIAHFWPDILLGLALLRG